MTIRQVAPGRLLGPADEVAPALLGLLLVGRGVRCRVVEVEAYELDDPASHTMAGCTDRTASMYGPPGRLYVYRSHGIHHCANVVVGPDGHGAAVLVRALDVVEGRHVAVDRRDGRGADDPRTLAGGPGRVGQVLDLDLADDGRDLLADAGPLRLLEDDAPTQLVASGPRVGVRRAPDRAWRFWLDGHPAVSRYRRHPAADPAVR